MRRKRQAHQKMWCNLLPPGGLPPLLAAHAADPTLSEAIAGAEGSHSAFREAWHLTRKCAACRKLIVAKLPGWAQDNGYSLLVAGGVRPSWLQEQQTLSSRKGHGEGPLHMSKTFVLAGGCAGGGR